ncbi:hypothetical protein MOU90_003674 [Vibrio parahaemolyticus]|nr:hypothetical protein [Vibrio parahaemolyticus]
MAILKNTVINRVKRSLDNGDFCLEDFKCDFPEQGSVLFKATFIAYPSFSFTVYESTQAGTFMSVMQIKPFDEDKTVIKCSMSPGVYKNEETSTHEDFDSATSEVYAWLDNIRNELVSLKVESQKSEEDDILSGFESYLDEPIENPDEFFSVEEVNDIKGKLEELQRRVLELEEAQQINQEDKDCINKVIEKTKSDVDVYPKGVWIRTAGNKILRTLKQVVKNKESRDVVIDVVKKLLSGS